MPVEKFTAREAVRRSVQKKATGMDRAQVAEQTEIARGWERQVGRVIDEPGRLASLRHAEWKHTEWRRIGYVMAEERMETYDPKADPKVTQWERERLQRIAEQEAATAPPAGGPDVRRYRVVAQRVDNSHPGCATLTNFAYAQSVEAAVAAVRRQNERPGGLYGVQGLYRVVQVVEEDAVTGAQEPNLTEAGQ